MFWVQGPIEENDGNFKGFMSGLFMAIGIGRDMILLGYYRINFERKECSLMWEL